MNTFVVAFLCSLMVGLLSTVVVRNFALRHGWLDQASTSRKIHARPIPRLGGIAIVVGFFAPLLALLFIDSSVGQIFRGERKLIWGLFGGGLLIACLGLYDDVRGADAKIKFTCQFIIASLLYAAGFRVEALANPFGTQVSLGLLSLPLTLFWIIGVINAMNLIDGLDGLAGGVALFAILTNFILAFLRGDILMTLMMAAMGGAVLGFLIFNFNPASIFMGDTGSMFLGFVLATVSLKTSAKSGTAVAMLVPIIALGLPIMDTLLAIIRRALLGRPMFSADKEHIHHRLMYRLLLSQRRAVLVLYGICCLFTLCALCLAYASSSQTAMLLTAISLVAILLMRKLGYLNLLQLGTVTKTRKRNVQLRSIVREINDRIRLADTESGLWDAIRPLADHLGTSRMALRFDRLEAPQQLIFETRQRAGNFGPLDLEVEIKSVERVLGALFLSWSDGRREINRDEELAAELLADSVAKALARAEPQIAIDNVLAFKRPA